MPYEERSGPKIEDEPSDRILQRAKDIAYRYLSFRARTRKEITDKLRERGFEEGTIEGVIEKLEELRLIDDLEFSRGWIRSRLENKPMGRWRLSQELQEKGVPVEIIQKALDEAFEGIDPHDLAIGALRRRMSQYRGLDKMTALRRMCGFLSRRGFDESTVREVATEIWRELEKDDLKGDQGEVPEIF